jgi:hypothetical protein
MATTLRIATTRWIMPVEFGSPFDSRGESLEAFQARIENANYPRTTTSISVSFLTDAAQLGPILPPDKGLELRGEPVVSVSTTYLGALAWLAGRSYALTTVSIPVTFHGREREIHGNFLPVIWENMTEPILTGREIIGWSKIYADIAPLSVIGDTMHCVASWHGFRFMDMIVDNLRLLTEDELKARQEEMASNTSEGSIHWKYIPKTGHPGEADADYLTMSTNRGAPPNKIKSMSVFTGDGVIEFHRARWEDLPTMVPVVNTLAGLEVKQIVGATVSKVESIGSGGMGQTIILE